MYICMSRSTLEVKGQLKVLVLAFWCIPGWLVHELPGILLYVPPIWHRSARMAGLCYCPLFSMCSGDLNSGPHTRQVLFPEPSLQTPTPIWIIVSHRFARLSRFSSHRWCEATSVDQAGSKGSSPRFIHMPIGIQSWHRKYIRCCPQHIWGTPMPSKASVLGLHPSMTVLWLKYLGPTSCTAGFGMVRLVVWSTCCCAKSYMCYVRNTNEYISVFPQCQKLSNNNEYTNVSGFMGINLPDSPSFLHSAGWGKHRFFDSNLNW